MIRAFLAGILLVGHDTWGLSGHVCKRERAETYMTSYNQAFLCQERYTTSCGHLDWRRCTRYRVQTCYTPRERYAVRYHVVETCCPGWSDDGTGACNIANCGSPCQNEGTCSAVEGTPTCICQDGYHGDHCQHERNYWDVWQTVVAILCGILVVIGTAITVYVYRRNRKTKRTRITPVPRSQGHTAGVISPTGVPAGVISPTGVQTGVISPTGVPAGVISPTGVPVQAPDLPHLPSHVMRTATGRAFPHPWGPQVVLPSAPMDCSET
eukprot:XP_011422222.1 PREDICTED: uncharacterized protein LOC105324759 [Crassostrea gigas]